MDSEIQMQLGDTASIASYQFLVEDSDDLNFDSYWDIIRYNAQLIHP